MAVRIAVGLCLIALCVPPAAAQTGFQPPNTGLSYAFASQYQNWDWDVETADDWVSTSSLMPATIRWWGSYWTPPEIDTFTTYSGAQPGAPPGGPTRWNVLIWENYGPSAKSPFDHPGMVVQRYELQPANVHETEAFTVTKLYGVQEKVYEYYADLNPYGSYAPLWAPTPGKKYWINISCEMMVSDKQWGWHEASGHYGDYALQTLVGDYMRWAVPCTGHDMAFELSPIPEPASLVGLIGGFAGLGALVCRRRRRF